MSVEVVDVELGSERLKKREAEFKKSFSYYLGTSPPLVKFVKWVESPMGAVVECQVCKQEKKMEGTQKRNFITHLLEKHRAMVEPEALATKMDAAEAEKANLEKRLAQIEAGKKESFFFSKPSRLSSSNINLFEQDVLAHVAVLGNLPLSFSDTPWFQYLASHLFPNVKLPGRSKVTEQVDELIERTRSGKRTEMERALAIPSEFQPSHPFVPVGAAIDYWSSRSMISFFGLILRYISPTWEVKEVVWRVEESMSGHNSSTLCNHLNAVDILSATPFALRSLTADGGSDIARMQRESPWCDDKFFAVCSSHTLHNIMKDALNETEVAQQLSDLPKIIAPFSNSGVRRALLRNSLEKLNNRTGKFTSLFRGVDKVWHSHTDSYDRLLHPEMINALGTLDPNDLKFSSSEDMDAWVEAFIRMRRNAPSLRLLVSCFTDIKCACLLLQVQNWPTVSRIYFLISFIRLRVLSLSDTDPVTKTFKSAYLAQFNRQAGTDLRKTARYSSTPLLYIAAAILDPYEWEFATKNSGPTEVSSAVGLIKERYDALFPRRFEVGANEGDENPAAPGRVVLSTSPESLFASEYTQFYNRIEVLKKNLKEDGSSLAELYSGPHCGFQRLAYTARSILCIPVSSNNVECTWSTAGIIDAERRSRLDPERLAGMIEIHKVGATERVIFYLISTSPQSVKNQACTEDPVSLERGSSFSIAEQIRLMAELKDRYVAFQAFERERDLVEEPAKPPTPMDATKAPVPVKLPMGEDGDEIEAQADDFPADRIEVPANQIDAPFAGGRCKCGAPLEGGVCSDPDGGDDCVKVPEPPKKVTPRVAEMLKRKQMEKNGEPAPKWKIHY